MRVLYIILISFYLGGCATHPPKYFVKVKEVVEQDENFAEKMCLYYLGQAENLMKDPQCSLDDVEAIMDHYYSWRIIFDNGGLQ